MTDKPANADALERIQEMREEHDLPDKQVGNVVSSGILGLDLATRIPGLPRGTMIDLYGAEGLGKTTTALTMMAERIRHGELCVYLDVEHRLSRLDSDNLVDIIIGETDLFQVLHPKDGDAAMSEMNRLAEIPEVKFIVMDSVAALVPKAALDNPDKSYQAAIAHLMSVNLKKLGISVYHHDTIIVFINQERMPMMTYGPVRPTPTGGKAIKFHTSLRFQMSGESLIKHGDKAIGQRARINVVKNSYRPPFGHTQLSIIYGQGVDRIRDLVDCGLEMGVITKQSSWLYYDDIKANGEQALVDQLIPRYHEVYDKIREMALQKEKEAQEERKAKREALFLAMNQPKVK